jgi:hypothetical protein
LLGKVHQILQGVERAVLGNNQHGRIRTIGFNACKVVKWVIKKADPWVFAPPGSC